MTKMIFRLRRIILLLPIVIAEMKASLVKFWVDLVKRIFIQIRGISETNLLLPQQMTVMRLLLKKIISKMIET